MKYRDLIVKWLQDNRLPGVTMAAAFRDRVHDVELYSIGTIPAIASGPPQVLAVHNGKVYKLKPEVAEKVVARTEEHEIFTAEA